ncbi:MAG TPA: hypothetical protein VMV17_24870 [Streptosporangiaceae bacterium]|nr:hypothetical protein [Streptosporangiaceae bacterium]
MTLDSIGDSSSPVSGFSPKSWCSPNSKLVAYGGVSRPSHHSTPTAAARVSSGMWWIRLSRTAASTRLRGGVPSGYQNV